MSREIRIRSKTTKLGPMVYVSLYDDRGRFVCTARFDSLTQAVAEAIDSYLASGRVTTLAQYVVRRSRDQEAHDAVGQY